MLVIRTKEILKYIYSDTNERLKTENYTFLGIFDIILGMTKKQSGEQTIKPSAHKLSRHIKRGAHGIEDS